MNLSVPERTCQSEPACAGRALEDDFTRTTSTPFDKLRMTAALGRLLSNHAPERTYQSEPAC
jgi:hypothetical protein